MDARDFVNTNYLAPGFITLGSFYVNPVIAATNSGAPDVTIAYELNQPVDFSKSYAEDVLGLRAEVLRRRLRQKMADLTGEFLALNDDLLRELAR